MLIGCKGPLGIRVQCCGSGGGVIRVRCVFAGLSRVKQRCPGTPPLLKGSWDVVGLSIYFVYIYIVKHGYN